MIRLPDLPKTICCVVFFCYNTFLVVVVIMKGDDFVQLLSEQLTPRDSEGWNLQWVVRLVYRGVEPTVGSQVSIWRDGTYNG